MRRVPADRFFQESLKKRFLIILNSKKDLLALHGNVFLKTNDKRYYMTHYYQETDLEVFDYQIYCLDEKLFDAQSKTPFLLRGPKPYTLQKVPYFVCIGAAQTFGSFCKKPFPILLQESLGISCINLGRGGAGPAFF